MAITLNILENEPINLSVAEPEAMDLSVGETTVIKENDYTNLINIPSIEGTELNGDVSLNALHGYTQDQIDSKLSAKANRSEIPSLNGYATEAWVESQNYASEDDIYTKGQTDNLLADKADRSEIPSLNGYATEQWVTDKHYLTEHQSLAGYATEQWVENKGYLTQHQSLANYYTKGQTNDLLDAKADTSDIPTKTSELTNDSGYITDAGVTSFNGNTGAVTYTAPVSSVNGRTGAVTVSVPSKTSDLTNDSGFLTSAPVTSVNGSTGAVTISVPTKTSDLVNDGNGNGADGVFVTDTQLPAKISLVLDDYLANAQMYATDATSKAVLSQAFGFDAEIVVPSNLTSTTALLYKLEPRTWFCWMNGTEMEFARLSVSANTSNSAITLYLRGRTSIATGIMGVDSAWTVSEILPIYNGGVS